MEVLRDRLAELRRAVRPEGEPELERAERPRVLERDIHGVELVLSVGQVPLLVRERARERAVLPHQHDPARLRQVEPLVRVDRHGVGALEPRKRSAWVGTAAAGSPYAPSTWSHTPRSAHTSAIASIGSIAPVRVVPAVATTATGVTPAATSRSIASRERVRPHPTGPSIGRSRRLFEPIPSSSTARVIE